MPDTRLTLENLRAHLRRYGLVYIVAVAAALILSNLLWTVTAPRVAENRRIVILLADAWTDDQPLRPLTEALLSAAQSVDPDMETVEFESLIFSDPEADYTGPMVLMTRLATGEGDIFLAGPGAMATLVQAGACLDLREIRAAGHLTGLEPCIVDSTDPETGAVTRQVAGLHLDTLRALEDMGVMEAAGACLALSANSPKTEAAVAVAQALIDALSGRDEQ